jgi:pimeloyl-ACP methyl ester carboxylesterase
MGKAIVPGSGHWPMIENPHFVNSLLLNFLYSVSPWPKK